MIDMEHADDDPGHPYAGTRTPHAVLTDILSSTMYVERAKRGLYTGDPDSWDPPSQVERICTGAYAGLTAAIVAAHTYTGIDSLTISSVLLNLGR